MMKSFFKKLAFVMALAMVVSSMAPAATAKAAENQLGICVQDEAYTAVRTSYEMTEGDEPVDFKFAGAPPTWKSLGLTWDSSDKTVAEVSQAGVVTAKAAGTTKITIVSADGAWAGEMALTVKEKEEVAPFTAEMLSDTTAKLTFADTTTKLADVKANLEFYYYVTETYDVVVPLVEKVEDQGNGVFYATLYDGVTFQNGITYGFRCGEGLDDTFVCEIGEVDFAELLVGGKKQYAVELGVDGVSCELSVKLYNENGKDVTATLKDSINVEYDVAEDEEGKYTMLDDTELFFQEAATATVKVTCFKLDEDGERVVLVDALPYFITAVEPEPYDILFNEEPAFSIVSVGSAIDWTKTTNSKIAVGDTGYELVVKLADNKKNAIATNGKYYVGNEVSNDWDYGTFTFKSTNVAKLYVNEDGQLMPNAKGEAVVLVYYKPNEGENPKDQLVAAIELNVQGARTVGDTSLSLTNKVLSTKDVNNSNKTTVTITVKDSLGDKYADDNNIAVEVKCLTEGNDLKNGAKQPTVSNTTPAVVDSKVVFDITANDTTVAAGKTQTYNYKVTIGNKTETFSITVKAPQTGATYSKYSLVFGDAKIQDATNLNDMKLTVSLAGVSNGVTAEQLDLTDAKLDKFKKSEYVGGYYYLVTKDGADITSKLEGKVNDGVLEIGLTTTKDVDFAATNGAVKTKIKVVDLVQGAGKYAVTVYKVAAASQNKAYFNALDGAKGNYTVAVDLPSVSYAGVAERECLEGTSIEDTVKKCFTFKSGTTTLTEDALDGYLMAIDSNPVIGDILFVNSVTFYKKSKVAGQDVYINCGTVTVGDYVTYVAE